MIDELKELRIKNLPDTPNKLAEIEKIKACRNIIELGYTVETAIKTLEENGIPVLLREADKVIIPHDDVKFTSEDDFIGVHKDEFFPVNSTIQTPTEGKAKLISSYLVGGRSFVVESPYYRNTIHLALNGEVEEVGAVGANWDQFPIAFLIKLKKIPMRGKGFYSLGDTCAYGHIDLDEDTWILCPQGFKEKILKQNPRIKIQNY